jgi:hypothetical protein
LDGFDQEDLGGEIGYDKHHGHEKQCRHMILPFWHQIQGRGHQLEGGYTANPIAIYYAAQI